MACCLPTCAQGSSVPVMVNALYGVFFVFLVSPWCLVLLGSLSLAGLPVVYKTWVTQVCLLLETRPLGGGWWGHYLCNLWGAYLKIHKNAYMYLWVQWEFMMWDASLSGTAQSPW